MDKKIIDTFKSNPKHSEYWVTTDGNAFTSEQKAESHSFNLEKKDRKIQHITRAEALKDEQAEATAKKEAEAKKAAEAKKKDNQKEAKTEGAPAATTDEKEAPGTATRK